MEHKYNASFDGVQLRPVSVTDLELLRNWRNNPSNSKFLQDIPYITLEMQQQWFQKDLLDQDSLTFAIEETRTLGRLVGSIALYHITDTAAEYGRFLIGDHQAHGLELGYKSLLLCLHMGFQVLHVQRIHMNVHERNEAARMTDEKIGFRLTGKHIFEKGGHELEMEITREIFYLWHPELKNVAIYTGG